jgi:hypothetical protein
MGRTHSAEAPPGGILISDLVVQIAALTGFEGRIIWDGSKPDG